MNNTAPPKQYNNIKNGKIELLRFVFCIFVLFFHLNKFVLHLPETYFDLHLTFFKNGAIGVEFFFVLSGFLMARSIYKKVSVSQIEMRGKELSRDYLNFIKRKYFAIFPYHFVAFAITALIFIKTNHIEGVRLYKYLFGSLPDLLLIQMSGVKMFSPNAFEWYISAMLLAMAIIYPICTRYYYRFTRFFAPVTALFLLGAMQVMSGKLSGNIDEWLYVAFKTNFRALAEIMLGATAFEISRNLQKINFGTKIRGAFAALEVFSFAAVSFFVVSDWEYDYQAIFLIFIFVLVTLAFTRFSDKKSVFDNRFCYFLGKLSLPLYLAQAAAIYVVMSFGEFSRNVFSLALSLGLTFVLGMITKFFGEKLMKIFKELKKT